jgi:hypothetical protein
MLQDCQHKVVTILLYHDCIGLIIVCLWKHHVNLLLQSSHIISTDEDPGLRIESFNCSNKFTWCFHKQTIICLIAMQTYKELIVSDLLEPLCNKSDNINKLFTACSKLVDNLGQAVRTQLVDGLSADLLQDVRFLCVYTRKNAQVVTGLQTSCYKYVHKLSTSCLRTACSQLL